MIYIVFFTLILGFFFLDPPIKVNIEHSFCEIGSIHYLGCDRMGRSLLSLFVYGSISTILIAVPSKLLSIFFALTLAFISSTGGRFLKYITNSLSAVFLSIPSLLIALVVIYSFGNSLHIFILSLLLSDWANSYETLYSKLNETYSSGYVYISKNFGASKYYILKNHIIPQLFPILIIIFITGIPSIIMTIAIYSYLGINFGSEFFGPGLGEQISFSKDYFEKSPLSIILPILGIFILVNLFKQPRKGIQY